ncbi:metallophosphoesterase [Aureitalea sp. L0-47]|uniref:metallophosphoesterase n=1 Tax=Aureitalea sp. L0-47 TaxID=2816962 RepID=UPI0022389062|nr:metallophosphoesterase [Aureitalea sp. L0-47]MCW5518911.1 metallophosphoesterase [Aureitalea sp. L0-47]
MIRWIIFIAIYVAIDIYAYQAFRTITRNNWLSVAYISISVLLLVTFIFQLTSGDSSRTMTPLRMYTFGLFLAVFGPKLLLVGIMFTEDIVRLAVGGVSKVSGITDNFHIPSRRKFISAIGLGLAAIPFSSLLYGMYRGKYNYQVLNYTLEFDDLPDAFDGYRITQISDVHSGSFDNEDKVAYGIDLVNEQKSDLIVFTGDLVNNVADEMTPWKALFAKLKANDGVYSILGNHDYGDYARWNSEEEKRANLEHLKSLQKEMGWDLLLNENRTIEKKGQSIKLVGVENWGAGGFKKAGDLDKACHGIATEDFKVLLSHDPSHWQQQVKKDDRNFQLTLSGHTHGMQFGIEIPGLIKWSPVKYRYENWAGIYEELGRYINVNRGFGFIGYPGRVGIWPEVSVIELKKRAQTA